MEEKRFNHLSDKSTKILLNRVIDYMDMEFGSSPSSEEQIMISMRLIELFPSLKVEKSDCSGIVSVLCDLCHAIYCVC